MIPPYIIEKVKPHQLAIDRLARINRIARARSLQREGVGPDIAVYDAGNKTQLPGKLVWEEDDPEHEDEIVRSAAEGLSNTYDYYYKIHARNSIDGAGMGMNGVVHYDEKYDNAFWDGQYMVFGDGDIFAPFALDPTVIAHELTHGVTEHTSPLTYFGQSGALNEHISDVFAMIIDQWVYDQYPEHHSWLIGEELFRGRDLQGRALRDMLHPGTAYDDPRIGKDPQPAHYDNLYRGFEDNGGVHINSGIPNCAFANAALQIGDPIWETVGQVWYDVLVSGSLSSNATIPQFAALTIDHGGVWANEIQDGWALVGVDPNDDEVPGTPSPCGPFLKELISDKKLVAKIQDILSHPGVRKLIARAKRR